ncbi:MAG: GNAT family protein [bacterium]|nr:GNAT family protein [bacterium]
MIPTQSKVLLRPLRTSDVGYRYVAWMNDPCTQRYTRRRGTRTTLRELKEFVADTRTSKDCYLAIIADKKHIGNLFLRRGRGRSADLSIMIGEKKARGKGYGGEAIRVASAFAFDKLGLTSLTAGSANPAFNALMQKLGWKRTRVKRAHFRIGRRRIDVVYWRMVKKDYEKRE